MQPQVLHHKKENKKYMHSCPLGQGNECLTQNEAAYGGMNSNSDAKMQGNWKDP